MFGPAILAIALAAAPQEPVSPPAGAQGQAPAADRSLDRIRERVARPGLHIASDRDYPEPTFRIEIHQHPYYTDLPFIWTFAGGGYPITAPGIEKMGGSMLPKSFGGADLLPMFTSLKRSLDARSARAEVQKAFAEYCATHICVMPAR